MGPGRLFPAVFLALATAAYGERLPIQTFTTADGLAHDRVKCFVRDSRGLLWVCSAAGVDWFDGHRFVGHALDDRLAFSTNDVFEAADHTYWIGTNGRGAVHLDPAGRQVARWPPDGATQMPAPRIRAYAVGNTPASNRVGPFFRDSAGTVWVGTDEGLYRLEPPDRFVHVPFPGAANASPAIFSFAETADGSLWVATTDGMYRRRRGDALQRQSVAPIPGVVVRLLAAGDTLWLGYSGGVARAIVRADAGSIEPEPLQFGGARGTVLALFREPSGAIWIGYNRGPLVRYDGGRYEVFTTAQGIPANGANVLGQDAEGNLWVSDATTGGAVRILNSGFLTYGRADGLRSDFIGQVFETPQRDVCALSGMYEREAKLDCFDGRRFQPVHPALPDSAVGWEAGRRLLIARDGSWWFATTQGIYRFAPGSQVKDLARVRPEDISAAGGLPRHLVDGLFEDARGDLWFWFRTAEGLAVARRRRGSGAVESIVGVPREKAVAVMGDDGEGGLWFGFYDGGVGRWRDGAFRVFGAADGIDVPGIAAIGRDRRGRLWIAVAAERGLLTVEAPSSDRPRFTPFTPSKGTLPRSVASFVEDAAGNMYFMSGYGIDRLDADRTWFRHFDKSDGLPDVQVSSGLMDRSGALWFSTFQGIARYVPKPVEPPAPPIVRIQSFRIGGVPYPLSLFGEQNVPDVSIPLGYSPVEIGFASPSGGVRYEYRLENGDAGAWRPIRDTSITFASPSAGSYQFAVRAVGHGGVTAGDPALVAFTIAPPFWQRGWFVAVVLIATAALGYAVHRRRLGRLLEVERIRTRIATDLHDDIGSSLSQIAILSELASRRVGTTASDVTPALQSIQRTASETVDAMSDIVWAINPKQDALVDLAGRMRRFGSDLLGGRDITFHFDASGLDAGIHVSAELRREAFLTFKEALRNAVRHSRCTRVAATLRATGGALELSVIDDGVGFDPNAASAGLGLASLRSRAAALGGVLDIRSAAGHGTSILLRLPLRLRRPFPYWGRSRGQHD